MRPDEANGSTTGSIQALTLTLTLALALALTPTLSSQEDDASLLISGSDDTFVHVWRATADPQAAGGGPARLRPLTSHLTGHTHNIFGAVFVPGSSAHRAVTCGADGEVRLHGAHPGPRPHPHPHPHPNPNPNPKTPRMYG